jgi:hypothetical protein
MAWSAFLLRADETALDFDLAGASFVSIPQAPE